MNGEVTMHLELSAAHDYSVYVERRNELLNRIKKEHPDRQAGCVVLFADFENESRVFRQESSFYYLTGITEPGVVLVLALDGRATLYMPDYAGRREQWTASAAELTQENAERFGFDEIALLGAECKGYQIHPFFSQEQYENVLGYIQKIISADGVIFALNPDNAYEYVQQRCILDRIDGFLGDVKDAVLDISLIIAHMRRIKDRGEIEKLYKAIEITSMAHEATARVVADGIFESEVQASLEYVFTAAGARPSFPSIVATGKHATILHYTVNSGTLKNGDLVVVDIGAEFNYYCADITRTYPVSGSFTDRQREIYDCVLETQEYIASIAKPGYWLSYDEQPDKSLHHLAKKFLEEKGYAQYFPHGIGHFLGLDVHDVGDRSRPLEEGDVITIEPGIYIPEEGIGVRIEDNYWVIKNGVVCLSEGLPKKAEDIEALVQQNFDSDAFPSDQE